MGSMPEATMSESPSSGSETINVHAMGPPKRTASDAGLKQNGGARPAKSVKRRASKACQCCRARKVRCNVVEHGAPCTNCRLDEVECIVSESKRKKKWTSNETATSPQSVKASIANGNGSSFPMSAHPPYEPLKRMGEHVPHALYQDLGKDATPAEGSQRGSLYDANVLMNIQRIGQQRAGSIDSTPIIANLMTPAHVPSFSLPNYIKPLHNRLSPDDIIYLDKKGALAIPPIPLRDQLLKCYAEFVHPYMPLLNIHELVGIIDRNDGTQNISLLLFQAIMFAGIATVDMRYLKQAGFATRRDARRAYFQKTRLLYDFDYEVDRISLIQSLLIMTYWYETPDDQKDSHHWMGIAVSLSHTIGLHRNPSKSANMDVGRQRLWKRIWWSTYMRDRLIALGMRRPTRIKNADFDVPMLTMDDFENAVLPEGASCIPRDCTILRDAKKQKDAAVMCIEMAKLCVCVSRVLSVQYSVLHHDNGGPSEEGSTRTTMLLASKAEPEVDQVQSCDDELREWKEKLPKEAEYMIPTWKDVEALNSDMVLNRSLLHLIYYATLSALHRPQVLPSAAMPARPTQGDQLDVSRKAVRLAAAEITAMANKLHELNLVRYLPTTGVTVLLPAIIIHLLDIKAPDEETRSASLQGFCQCMQIMAKLRDIYAAADYSTAFLEAAIRKAEITLPQKTNEVKEPRSVITSAQGLMDAGRRMTGTNDPNTLTPPPDGSEYQERSSAQMGGEAGTDEDMARHLRSYLATSPPDSEEQDMEATFGLATNGTDFEPDFDSMINLDAAGEGWLMDEGGYAAMQGESSGFALDMNWMKGMNGTGVGSMDDASLLTMNDHADVAN